VHNTVSKDKLWESPILNPGQKFSYTFTRPGTYEYLCTLHPEMVGKVIVK
jgi:plastocyanin